MSSLNKAMIIGNLGADPDLRYMPSGEAVANLSVATSSKWKDKQTGEAKEKTEWHRVSFFGRTAEVAGEYLRKGSKIYVEGELKTRKWQDKDGRDRYTTEIKGRSMVMLDGKSNDNGQRAASNRQQPGDARDQDGMPPSGSNTPTEDFDDDIPF